MISTQGHVLPLQELPSESSQQFIFSLQIADHASPLLLQLICKPVACFADRGLLLHDRIILLADERFSSVE
jgi:hypothetical protein